MANSASLRCTTCHLPAAKLSATIVIAIARIPASASKELLTSHAHCAVLTLIGSQVIDGRFVHTKLMPIITYLAARMRRIKVRGRYLTFLAVHTDPVSRTLGCDQDTYSAIPSTSRALVIPGFPSVRIPKVSATIYKSQCRTCYSTSKGCLASDNDSRGDFKLFSRYRGHKGLSFSYMCL